MGPLKKIFCFIFATERKCSGQIFPPSFLCSCHDRVYRAPSECRVAGLGWPEWVRVRGNVGISFLKSCFLPTKTVIYKLLHGCSESSK